MYALQGHRSLNISLRAASGSEPADASVFTTSPIAVRSSGTKSPRCASRPGNRLFTSAVATDAPPASKSSSPGPSPAANIQRAKLASGHEIPLLGYGTFGVPPEKTKEAVATALEVGFRHFDTAVIYQNEAQLGKAVNDWLNAGKGKREDLFIVTKIWSDQKSEQGVETAVRASLGALKLDYIDLVLIHWPLTNQPGGAVVPAPQDTWKGLETCVEKGLVKSIGVSNHSPEKIKAWFKDTRIPVSVNQVEAHPQFRNDRILYWCRQNGIHMTSYAPLSSPAQMEGMQNPVPNLMKDNDTVKDIAKRLGKTPAQVLLNWGIRRGTSVIPKAMDIGHQQENAGAVGWELPEADFKALSSLTPQLRYFVGTGLAISESSPWGSYSALWDEEAPSA